MKMKTASVFILIVSAAVCHGSEMKTVRGSASEVVRRRMGAEQKYLEVELMVDTDLADASEDGVVDMTDSTDKKPYGDPASGGCLDNEMPVRVMGLPGAFCSPKCDSSTPCPPVEGGTAVGLCALKVPGEREPTQCILECATSDPGSCPDAATCEPISGIGICSYVHTSAFPGSIS
jgi:hypothetical protein|mmetsp:Transcript_4227/g.7575  ORF Transcript_4227/g.7575 Transcript_4227/m.7575 type:complete len:176 (-) Transcript_4227:161-688(-)